MIVDALKRKYTLPLLLKKLTLAKSSYYYQKKRLSFTAKHENDYKFIVSAFYENKQRYGYRRIKVLLDRKGHPISKKVIRCIMHENSMIVRCRNARKYSSYRGEISPDVPNVIKRNFRANKPNQKCLRGVTEFSIPAGKVYLSPMIDCYDGMPVAWNINSTPDAALVNAMLDQAIHCLNIPVR